MKKEQGNKMNILYESRDNHPAEVLLANEFKSLPQDEMIKKIEEYFNKNLSLYSHGKQTLEVMKSTERILLWLIQTLTEAFLLKTMKTGDLGAIAYDLKLRELYQKKDIHTTVKVGNKVFTVFPDLKRDILSRIIERWHSDTLNKETEETFSFLVSMHKEGCHEEKKIIEDLFRKKTSDLEDAHEVKQWLKIKPKEWYPDEIAKLFVMARARTGGLELALQNIRNAEIVEKLGIEDVADNMLPSLKSICTRQIELDIVTGQYLKQLLDQFLLSKKEKVTHRFISYDYLEIHVFLDALKRGMIGGDWENFLDEMIIRMGKMGIISESGLNLVFNQQNVFAQLLIRDLEGLTRAAKMWSDEPMPF